MLKEVGSVEDTARYNKDEYRWFKRHKTQPINDRASLVECIRMLSTKGTDFCADALIKMIEKAGINAEINSKKSRVSIYTKGKSRNVCVASIEVGVYGCLTVKCMYDTSTLMTVETKGKCSDADIKLVTDTIAYAVTAGKDADAKNNTAIQRVKAVSYVANKYNMYRNDQAHAKLSSSGSVEGVITGEGRGKDSYKYSREIDVIVDNTGIMVGACVYGIGAPYNFKMYKGHEYIRHDNLEYAYSIISGILKKLNKDVVCSRNFGNAYRIL